jgi:hypothetical protein
LLFQICTLNRPRHQHHLIELRLRQRQRHDTGYLLPVWAAIQGLAALMAANADAFIPLSAKTRLVASSWLSPGRGGVGADSGSTGVVP